MGKLKRRSKMSLARANKKSAYSDENHNANTSNQEKKNLQKISPLLQKLSSPVPNDKSMAVSTISVLCDSDANLRKLFLRENLIKIIMEHCINDNNEEIMVDSFGLLRNLVIEEGYDVAIFLWRSDIWLSIENGLKKSTESLKHLNDAETKNKNKSILFDFMENLISLIGGLAEGSDELFHKVFDKIIGNSLFVQLLKGIIEADTFKVSSKVLVTTLGFIYDMSTLSMDFIEWLHNEVKIAFPSQESLEARFNGNIAGNPFLIGLDFQLFEYEIRSGNNISSKQIDLKMLEIFNKFFQIIGHINLEETMNLLKFPVDNAEGGEDKQRELNYKKAKESFQSIDVILDLSTTLFEFKGELVATSESQQDINDSLVEVFISKVLPFLNELLVHASFTDKVMVCLNNLTWLMLSIDFNGQESQWQEATYPIASIIMPKTFVLINTFNEQSDLNEIIDHLNSTWVLLKSNEKLLPEFQPEHISSLISLSSSLVNPSSLSLQNSQELNLNLYFSSCIGLLTIFAKYLNDIEITKTCSQFIVDKGILEILKIYNSESNSNEVHKKYSVLLESILNESINSIFEIFDDAAYPYDLPIFVEGNLLSVLKDTCVQFKKIYKSIDKNKFTELKEKSEETFMNLDRFIQYKQSERA